MADNLKLIEEYIKEKAPQTELDIVLCMAEVKAKYNAVQNETAKHFGISDRTLKNYKAKYKQEFEDRLEEMIAQEVDELADINPNQFVSEEQADKFFRVMYEKAVSKQGTARDRELYMEATGLSGRDYFHLQAVKANTLRWFIKQNLSKIGQYMDTKELGIQLQASPYLYNGDKESLGNTEKFTAMSLENDAFKLEMMLAGLTFYSLYNGIEHPELMLMQTAVRVDRLERGIAEQMNKEELKAYAKGEDIVKDAKPKQADKAKLDALRAEVFTPDEIAEMDSKERPKAKLSKLVKTPKLPDVETVEQKADEYHEELQVLLNIEDELKALFAGYNPFK